MADRIPQKIDRTPIEKFIFYSKKAKEKLLPSGLTAAIWEIFQLGDEP